MSESHSTKKLSFVGTEFGHWTVLEEPFTDKKGQGKKCVCQCKCGRVRTIPLYNLRAELSASCRICANEHRTISIIGKRFGKRKVIAKVESIGNDHQRDLWEVRCDCGAISNVRGSDLRRGRHASCLHCRAYAYGNIKRDLVGRQFGKWTVLSFAGHGHQRTRLWNCRCDCGTEEIFSSGYLGSITVGGCQRCKAERMLRIAETAVWVRVQKGAKDRGYEFALDREATFRLLKDQQYRCALTGLPITIAHGRKSFMHGGTTASIDRIDNAKGYVWGNIWWVHKEINLMKHALPIGRFLTLCRLVAKMHPSPDHT